MQEARETALAMIQRHRVRAQAVAEEHAAEMQTGGDTESASRWREISMAIAELRVIRGAN